MEGAKEVAGIARPPDRFETERLRLRLPTLADASDVFAYASDPEVTRYLAFPAEALRPVVSWAMDQEPIHRVWAVCDVENRGSARVLLRDRAGMIADRDPHRPGVPEDGEIKLRTCYT